jgi:hypothetical protein
MSLIETPGNVDPVPVPESIVQALLWFAGRQIQKLLNRLPPMENGQGNGRRAGDLLQVLVLAIPTPLSTVLI